MERGADLRAVRNRKLVIKGEHTIDASRTCVLLPEFEAIDSEGKVRKVLKEGDIVTITTKATINSLDRVLLLRANPALYHAGNVRMIPMISPADEHGPITMTYQALQRIDLSKLNYFMEVYIDG